MESFVINHEKIELFNDQKLEIHCTNQMKLTQENQRTDVSKEKIKTERIEIPLEIGNCSQTDGNLDFHIKKEDLHSVWDCPDLKKEVDDDLLLEETSFNSEGLLKKLIMNDNKECEQNQPKDSKILKEKKALSSQVQNPIVRKRQAKATKEQIDYMVDYFVQFPHVATGKFKTIDGKSNLTGSWEELSKQLNDLREDGKIKDVKSWKATWRDNKTLVSQKISKIRASQATGNIGNTPKLTEREEKILGLMGFDYVEGVDWPDAEEVPGALELLAAGQDNVGEIAVPLTLRAHPDESLESHTDYEMLLDTTVDVPSVNKDKSSEDIGAPRRKKRRIPAASKTKVTKTSTQDCQQPKLDTQLRNARDQFAELAERQISCMEMVAGAMQQIAENDRRRNEILQSFLELERKREETINALVNTVQDCVAKLNRNN